MAQASDRSRYPQRTAVILTVLVGVIATAVAYQGTRESTRAPVSPPTAPASTTLPVETIVLPMTSRSCPPDLINGLSSSPARSATRRGW